MSNKMNLSFLKSQLEAKKALLQKSAAAQNQVFFLLFSFNEL